MLNILFCGDFAPCRGYEDMVIKNKALVFGDLLKDISKVDFSFLNLECPLCFSGAKIKKCGPNLRANPNCISAVTEAGFDVVGLANNHIMDYGQDGLEETINVCEEAGLLTCGAGKDLQMAQQSLFVIRKEIKIAIVAVAEREFSIAEINKAGAAPLDPIDNLEAIKKAKEVADFVFVTIHGGNEYYPYPRPGLRKVCRFFIEQGVDGVICHHAHVPGAYEIYENKPIVYSLGNLVFDYPNPPNGWNKGYAIRLEYDQNTKGLTSCEVIPYTQSVMQGGVVKMQGEAKTEFMASLDHYKCILLDEDRYENEWKVFFSEREKEVLIKMFFPIQFRGLGRMSRIFSIEKMLLGQKSLYAKLNYLSCESHREVLLSVLLRRADR
ncbi:MAG TPA: CapA family protein [Campylobacterales bacterium]|nr:CapA family protein [Campylobacterales bacterium]